jgi:hypothetical protein
VERETAKTRVHIGTALRNNDENQGAEFQNVEKITENVEFN